MIDHRLLSELTFKTSKSGGPGGQHVNKTETKIELLFDINASKILTTWEKSILFENLSHKINQNGILSVVVSETRSQVKNKEIAVNRFFSILKKGLKKNKKRIPTKTPNKAIKKRLLEKSKRSELKKNRGNIKNEDY